MKIEYHSNNSGGEWWLSDQNWKDLESAGWTVDWKKDGRWLGALATSATRSADSMEEAIAEFERVTGQYANSEGCPCCGQPHNFHETNET
jgi:hypothetical protein